MKKRRGIWMTGSAVVAGLVIGVLFGRDGKDMPKGMIAKDRLEKSRSPRKVAVPKSEGERSYRKLVDHVRRNGFIPQEGADFLGRANREEILAMMETISAEYESENDWFMRRQILESIQAGARELCRREELVAVEWVLGRSSSMMVCQKMIAEFSRLDPEAGKKLIWPHYRRFGNSAVWDFADSAFEGAVGRNSEMFLKCEEGDRITRQVQLHGFADDFDFSDYLSRTKSSAMIGSMFQAWAARDPEAAGKALEDGTGATLAEGTNFSGAL